MVARITFVLAVVSLALAQSDTPPKPVKIQVNEVIVPVTVTDEKGRFVSNLEAKDFRILDEGKEQRIEFFSRDRNQPVVVGFLIDLSNSSRIQWKHFQDAAIELVLNLLPGDKKYSGYLISYANEPELQVNTTSQSDKLVEKLSKMKPGGGAALYDAIYMACMRRQLVDGEPYDPRRVLIVIGDGVRLRRIGRLLLGGNMLCSGGERGGLPGLLCHQRGQRLRTRTACIIWRFIGTPCGLTGTRLGRMHTCVGDD